MSAPLKLGDRAHLTRIFTDQDLRDLHTLTGAPIADGDVPEPLINSLFSYLLGVDLPGQGTNYLKQETRFLDTARRDEPLTASVKITRLRPEKHLVDLETNCHNATGNLIATGRALVYAKDVVGAF
jgi:3-hydroxybutyryl-CoA dehydratase